MTVHRDENIRNHAAVIWLSGLSGELQDLIANSNVSGQAVVEVRKSDEAFSSTNCGAWEKVSKVPKAPQQSVRDDGVWLVDRQLAAPGRYRGPGRIGLLLGAAVGIVRRPQGSDR